MSLPDNSGIVVGVFLALWALRELIPLVLKLQSSRRSMPPGYPPSQEASPADASGAHGVFPTIGEIHRTQQWQGHTLQQVLQELRQISERLARIEGPRGGPQG